MHDTASAVSAPVGPTGPELPRTRLELIAELQEIVLGIAEGRQCLQELGREKVEATLDGERLPARVEQGLVEVADALYELQLGADDVLDELAEILRPRSPDAGDHA
jgi:hypothetical protein